MGGWKDWTDGSPSGVKYRAPYGANNIFSDIVFNQGLMDLVYPFVDTSYLQGLLFRYILIWFDL